MNDLVITLASMSNQVERSEYVKKCAERLDVEEDYIWQLLNKQGAGKHIERSTQPTIKPSTKKSAKESVEQLLIECLIQYPQFISQSQLQLTKEDFSSACHTELIELLWDMADKNGGGVELGDLINRCTSKESRDIVSGLIMKKRPQSEEDTQFNGEVQFNACMNKMMEFHKREVKRSVRKESAEDKVAKARRLTEIRRGNTTIY